MSDCIEVPEVFGVFLPEDERAQGRPVEGIVRGEDRGTETLRQLFHAGGGDGRGGGQGVVDGVGVD